MEMVMEMVVETDEICFRVDYTCCASTTTKTRDEMREISLVRISLRMNNPSS